MSVLNLDLPNQELSSERTVGTSLKIRDFRTSLSFAFIYIRALNLENEMSYEIQQSAFVEMSCSLKSQLATM